MISDPYLVRSVTNRADRSWRHDLSAFGQPVCRLKFVSQRSISNDDLRRHCSTRRPPHGGARPPLPTPNIIRLRKTVKSAKEIPWVSPGQGNVSPRGRERYSTEYHVRVQKSWKHVNGKLHTDQTTLKRRPHRRIADLGSNGTALSPDARGSMKRDMR
jgi:hypothetical protein